MKEKKVSARGAAKRIEVLLNGNKCLSVFEHWHITDVALLFYDFAVINGAYLSALLLRFDLKFSMIPERYILAWLHMVPVYSVFSLLLFCLMRLYKSLWRFASYNELARVFVASVVASVFHCIAVTIMSSRMPISYYLVGSGLQLAMLLLIRFLYRFVILETEKQAREAKTSEASHVMLVGAGSAGQMLIRDLYHAKELKDRVCCIIDDDKNKWGRYIDEIPIVGGRDDILANVQKYKIEKIYVAIPGADATARRDILNICSETKCELKNLPGMYQLVNGEVTVGDMKNVDIEDLLGREPIKINSDEIFSFLSNKVILVTGGGGSIGSELCRQIAKHNPKQLVIFDIYENNAHAIQLELRDNYPELNLEVLIGSVRDSSRLSYIFETYKPDVVYHAAAHKHVPLMEDSPCETIKNNVIGTYKTAYAAMMNGCRRFVLISTDKAVNPTNIMGASKRLCEMVIQSFDRKIRDGKTSELPVFSMRKREAENEVAQVPKNGAVPHTEFVAVRFGNVLGSNGSVIPRFKEQIARGGPVTVTHPDIIRYFMTIPEAAGLVLQAGTYAEGGEIFVLDMGAPVKIDTLARNLIKLSGLRPDIDIEIRYTGLRPGEKLFEEKLMSEEGLKTTPNKLIHIGCPIPFDTDMFLWQLRKLMYAAYNERVDDIRDLVSETVPTYHPAGKNGTEEKGKVFEEEMKAVVCK